MPRRVPYSEDVLRRFNEWYDKGYEDGLKDRKGKPGNPHPKKRRKLSAWNKFVKANSKKPRFIYRTGKLNLKKMAVAFRKTPAGKKKGKR